MDLKKAIGLARARTDVVGRPDLLPLVEKRLQLQHARGGTRSAEYVLVRLIVFRLVREEELKNQTRARSQQREKLREACFRTKLVRRQEMLCALGEWIDVLEEREVLSPLIAQVMRLNVLGGTGGKEVASLLGVSQDVVYQRKKRGLDRILSPSDCPEIVKACLTVPPGRKKRPVPSVLHRIS